MVCANKPLIVAVAVLFVAPAAWADRTYMSETHSWNGPITVSARGQLMAGGAAYTFALSIENNNTPALHLGDKVRVTNVGPSEFSPITWWQNGRRYAGKSCSGFLFKKCKKTYHNHQNKEPENYRVSEVRFGLRPLAGGDCRDDPKVGLNQEMIVSFPSRLCVIGEGRFPRPASVPGPGNPTGPVQKFTMIGSAGLPVLHFTVNIVREK